jgi:hypothetical protein
MERDQARSELAQWQSTGGACTTTAVTVKQDAPQDTTTPTQEPPTKKKKIEGIPEEDLELMTTMWQTLSQQRKPQKKDVVANVIPPENLKEFTEIDKKSWHKARNKASIVDRTGHGDTICTAGRDKQLAVYSLLDKTLLHMIAVPGGVVVSSVDMSYENYEVAAATTSNARCHTAQYSTIVDLESEFTVLLNYSVTQYTDIIPFGFLPLIAGLSLVHGWWPVVRAR